MKPPDAQEIASLFAQARAFLRGGGRRRHVAANLNELAREIEDAALIGAPRLREKVETLRGWLAQFENSENRAKARDHSRKQSVRASAPRKLVTAAELTKFRDDYEREHGQQRGWKKAACIEFGISLKTLNDRMVE